MEMTDTRIGRLLAASLHQAIGDVLPDRLEFYEVWLRSKAWRDGSIALAAMTAVLGFLRTEDEYQQVMEQAGRLAADWTVSSMSPVQRRLTTLLPRRWRARAALRIAATIVRDVSSGSQASTRVRRSNASLDVTSSLFCRVRHPGKVPLCAFYRAVAAETLVLYGLAAEVHIESCHAVEGANCRIKVDLFEPGAAVVAA
jgi:hypothetical protein